jgi:hypothetical protein
MFVKQLSQAGHVRTFSITKRGEAGWEVRDTQDERVLRQVYYTDWHRVERSLNIFNIMIDDLESRGWATNP